MKTQLEIIAEYLGADTNTVVATFTALLVLVIGYLLNGLIRSVAFVFKQYELRKTFKLIIREIAKSSTKQAVEFEEFSKILTTSNIRDFELKQLPNPHLLTWEKLNFSDYYKAFMVSPKFICNRENRRNAINSIYEHIAIILTTENRFFDNVKEVSDKYNKYQDNWNSSVESIKQEFYLFLRQTENNMEIRPFVNGFIDIMKEWQNLMIPRNLKIINDTIFPRIEQLCREHLQLNGTLKIINCIDDARFALINIETLFDDYKSMFQSFATSYRHAGEKIVKFSQII